MNVSEPKPIKFTFDKNFEVHEVDVEKLRVEATLKQMGEARATAFAEGVEEGRNQYKAELDAHIAQTLDNVAATLEMIANDGEQLHQINEAKSAKLAHIIATKIAGRLVAEKPEGVIETVIQEALRAANRENALTIYVADDIAKNIEARIASLKGQSTFSGEIKVIGQAALHGVDCRIEWTDGGLEHDHDDVVRKIEAIMENFLAAKIEAANKAELALPQTTDQPLEGLMPQ